MIAPERSDSRASARAEFAAIALTCRQGIAGAVLASAFINVLMLTGAFFMLQVYDRVLPSRSVPTLAGLAILAAALFIFLGLLDLLRHRILLRIANYFDAALADRVYVAVTELARRSTGGGDAARAVRDLDQVRSFISSGGPPALFDLPWLVLYLGICFAFHAWLGITVLLGAIVLVSLTIYSELALRKSTKSAFEHSAQRNSLAEASSRNADALYAMAILPGMLRRWLDANQKYLEAANRIGGLTITISAFSKTFRLMLQSAVLAVGALLVTRQEATGGVIIASSILASRALAPLETAIAHWKGLIAARQSWGRLRLFLALAPRAESPLRLSPPASRLDVEGIYLTPPGANRPAVRDVSFRLARGEGLGIIGPSASGKSTLARALVGVWRPDRGEVRLDGAALGQWSPHELGRHVGYLPQQIELFAGTVAMNIARFDAEPQASAVIAAAEAAGAHEMILRLPNGYQTEVGQDGAALSAGQRQRIGLARALYGDPFLLVLDEPNSNLDIEGDMALTQAVIGARRRGAIVLVIAHRPSALEGLDRVLVMNSGAVQALGPKSQILRSVLRPATPAAVPSRELEASVEA